MVLHEAMASSPLPIVLIDAEGRVVFANQPACAVLGLRVQGEGWERESAAEDERRLLDVRIDERVTSGDEGWHQLGTTNFDLPDGESGRGTVWASLGTEHRESTDPPLTNREREILGLVATGLRTDEIAGRLGLSPETVKSHIHNAMMKLRAHTRSQAVAIALSTGQVTYTGGSPSGA